MLQRVRQTSAGWIVAALYALAMVATGVAHRPVAAPLVHSIELAAYALPDGSLPPLCTHDEGAPSGGAQLSAHCDACALSSAPGLAPVATDYAHAPVVRALVSFDRDDAGLTPAARRAPTSRGPPLA